MAEKSGKEKHKDAREESLKLRLKKAKDTEKDAKKGGK